jgi:hypothetical protein
MSAFHPFRTLGLDLRSVALRKCPFGTSTTPLLFLADGRSAVARAVACLDFFLVDFDFVGSGRQIAPVAVQRERPVERDRGLSVLMLLLPSAPSVTTQSCDSSGSGAPLKASGGRAEYSPLHTAAFGSITARRLRMAQSAKLSLQVCDRRGGWLRHCLAETGQADWLLPRARLPGIDSSVHSECRSRSDRLGTLSRG